MINFLTLFFLVAIVFLIIKIISRKQHEVAEKELQQKELLIQEMQTILNTQTSSEKQKSGVVDNDITDNNYLHQIAEHFKSNGYSISELSKTEGIDLIGIKEKELLLIYCERTLKEVKKSDLLLFIASCTLYVDHNPMFKNRSITRIYSTSRPITDEARQFVRENALSLHLNETV